jgi:membrane protease YdiL (CAAX protease family)
VDVVSTVLLFVPILLVLWLANLSHRRRIEGDVRNERTLKLLSYGLLFLFYALLMLAGLVFLGLGLAGALTPEFFDAEAMGSFGYPVDRLPWIGASFLVFSLLGLLLLTRPARRFFARFTPIDPTHPVHAVALSLSATVLINLAATVAVGLENLADMVQTATAQAGGPSNPAPGLWAQNITFLIMGLVGVGLFARRSLRAALIRLGIVMPTVNQAIAGIGLGLLMVPLVVALEALARQLGVGTSAGVERLTEQLIGPLTQNITGILTLGLAAALGEETVFRGALQPRFGLLLTSLLFALLHSQYGISFSTFAVFGVGLVLGLLRMRANTTTAMLTHAVYNMSLGLISFLGMMQNS